MKDNTEDRQNLDFWLEGGNVFYAALHQVTVQCVCGTWFDVPSQLEADRPQGPFIHAFECLCIEGEAA